MTTSKEYLDFALSLTKVSRNIIREKKDFAVSEKEDKSFVTEVDLEIEKVFREHIASKYPAHGIIGEEFPNESPESEFQWILDPIDGTLAFTKDIPLYGTLISLYRNQEPVLGIIDHPGINYMTWGAKGLGVWVCGEKISIKDLAPSSDWSSEVIGRSDRANFERSNIAGFQEYLDQKNPRVRAYADCFGHSLACRGSLGAMIDINVRVWDIAATRMLIEEAGGKFELIEQTDPDINKAKLSMIAGKPSVVDSLVSEFNMWKS